MAPISRIDAFSSEKIQKALTGNKIAYTELLREISHHAKRFLSGRLAITDDVDDLIQEILLSVHKALPTYDPARPFTPWLASIMHFRFKDYLRKFYTQKHYAHLDIQEIEDFLLQDVTPEQDTDEYITKALNSLAGKQHAVIEAIYVQDLSVKQASERLNMSVSAVKVTAHRAYEKLRKQKLKDGSTL